MREPPNFKFQKRAYPFIESSMRKRKTSEYAALFISETFRMKFVIVQKQGADAREN